MIITAAIIGINHKVILVKFKILFFSSNLYGWFLKERFQNNDYVSSSGGHGGNGGGGGYRGGRGGGGRGNRY